MKYDIKAVPTLYNGVNYRSKLEAQWAAFFDEMGWEHTYEPFEINGLIPDFIIYCTTKSYPVSQMIVEIKPEIFMTKKYIQERCHAFKDYPAHTLFLTERPFKEDKEFCGGFALGIGEQVNYIGSKSEPHPLIMKVNDIGSLYISYDSMIHEEEARKNFMTRTSEIKYFVDVFNDCKNRIQFKY